MQFLYRKLIIGCVALLTVPSIAVAQEATEMIPGQEDFQLWTSVSAGYKPMKGMLLTAEQGFRFSDNGSSLTTTYTDLGVRYKLHDYVKVAGAYRFAIKPDEIRHRLQADLRLKSPKFARFNVGYRMRYQSMYAPFSDPRNHWRNKISLKYDIKDDPITPFVAGELFTRMAPGSNYIEAYRLTFGASLNLPGARELAVSYRFEEELNVMNPLNAHILSIAYDFRIKKK